MNTISQPLFGKLTEEEKGRQASNAVRGYFYQFQATVLEVLASKPQHLVRVEGIEDVDIFQGEELTVIQVKYHDMKGQFGLSKINHSLINMLKTIVSRPNENITFRIYIHAGESTSKIPQRLSATQIADALGNKMSEFGSLGGKLVKELANRLTLEQGEKFEVQQERLVEELKTALNCSREEAQLIHMPRAVHIIGELARTAKEAERLISKNELLRQLKISGSLRADLLKSFKLEGEFIKYITRQLKYEKAEEQSISRWLLVSPSDSEIARCADLIEDLSQAPGKRFKDDAKVWTVIVESSANNYATLKKELAKRKVLFNDGYEDFHLNFQAFFREPIRQKGQKNKITRVSYSIRLLNYKKLTQYRPQDWDQIPATAKIYAFGQFPYLDQLSIRPRLSVERIAIDEVYRIFRSLKQK